MSPIPIDNVTKSEHSWLLWLKPTECPQNAAAFVMPVSKVTRAGWCALGKVLSIVVRLPTDQLFLKLVVIIRLAGGMCGELGRLYRIHQDMNRYPAGLVSNTAQNSRFTWLIKSCLSWNINFMVDAVLGKLLETMVSN